MKIFNQYVSFKVKPFHCKVAMAIQRFLWHVRSRAQKERSIGWCLLPTKNEIVVFYIFDFIFLHRLFNGASLSTFDGKPSLYLDGVDDYAITPSFPMHTLSLTLAVWLKTPNPERTMYIFSDYIDALNATFRHYIEGNKFVSELFTAEHSMLRYVTVRWVESKNLWYFPDSRFLCWSSSLIS